MDLTTAISAACASVRRASAAFDCHARATSPITSAVPLPPAIVRGESATGGAVRAGETVRSADGCSAGAHRRASALLSATRSASERICCRFWRRHAEHCGSKTEPSMPAISEESSHSQPAFRSLSKNGREGGETGSSNRALTSTHTHPGRHTHNNITCPHRRPPGALSRWP